MATTVCMFSQTRTESYHRFSLSSLFFLVFFLTHQFISQQNLTASFNDAAIVFL